MKVKTSITLSEDVLREVDRLAADYKNRSDFIENALRAAIQHRMRQKQEAWDREILDRYAQALGREAEDVLDYQAPL